MSKERLYIFDTTLRDGAQTQGVHFSLDEKIKIAHALDNLGVDYIEGGWPGANPTDTQFFQKKLKLKNSSFTAFGMTKKSGRSAENDPGLSAILNSNTNSVCLVGKSWDFHVDVALGISNEENLENISETTKHFVKNNKEFMFDAEHFFDGYKENPDFSLDVLEGAARGGADCVVLCDTNGGSLPHEVEKIVKEVSGKIDCEIGVHLHNDTGCGVANAIAGVMGGATQVQGTINGYGERVGNCDLVPVIANLSLKLGFETISKEHLENLTSVSRHIAELANFASDPQQPYVGTKAFAHKAGLHTSAIARRKDAYEHIDPESVGNGTRFLVSEMSGRSTIELKVKEIGIDLDTGIIGEVVETLKELEYEGYHFEAADASLELLIRSATGWMQDYFEVDSFSVNVGHNKGSGARAWNDVAVEVNTNAVVTVIVGEEKITAEGEGNGPVNALDSALRKALRNELSHIDAFNLTDYKVRVLESERGTGAVTRVLLDTTDGEQTWTTIGVSTNIIEASWQALVDSLVYGLLHTES
mgnify:CR=1 FL=1